MNKIEFTVYSKTMTLCMQGDRVEDFGDACDPNEYGTFESMADAIAEAKEIAADPESVRLFDQGGKGIGAVEHRLVYVDAFLYDEDNDEWIPSDAKGNTDDPCGPESVYYHDCIDDRPDIKAAWDKAVHAKWAYLDYKDDEYYTVRAFLEEDEE